MTDRSEDVMLAARNNAVWCSIVCSMHGVDGTFAPDAWTCATRTPENYPDAVTLQRSVDGAGLLDRVDTTSGCSIKDSFADLDLERSGFEPLFDASWIRRPPGRPRHPAGTPRWNLVRDAEALADWETAWGEGDPGTRLFLPGLLERDDVAILAIASTGGATTTAILSTGGGVLGVSNVVTGATDPAETFSIVLDAAAERFPGVAIVGYEQGPLLDAARDVGFEVIGPLRVWMRP
jgi:hypothetical protein